MQRLPTTANDCQRLSVDDMFCLHCGSANIEPIKDILPF